MLTGEYVAPELFENTTFDQELEAEAAEIAAEGGEESTDAVAESAEGGSEETS